MTNILIKGLYRTGSHALVDLLSEYDNIGVLPFEFDHFRAPANVADQLSEKASQNYPNLIKVSLRNKSFKWQIFEKIVPDQVIKVPIACRLLNRIPAMNDAIKRRRYNISLKSLSQYLNLEIPVTEKVLKTREWIKDVGNIYAEGKDYLVIDQPFLPSTNSEVWPQVFEPFKLIFSLRHPADQFADIIRSGFLFMPFRGPQLTWAGGLLEVIYGRDRAGAFAIFKDAVKRLYEDLSFIRCNVDPANFLIVEFEKLVTDYYPQKARIEAFIGSEKGNHTLPKTRFIPEQSARNVGIHNSFLTPEEINELTEIEFEYRRQIKM